jgi:hypothetical protein
MKGALVSLIGAVRNCLFGGGFVDRALALERDGAHRKATGWANQEGHREPRGWRIVGGMRTEAQGQMRKDATLRELARKC